MSVVRGRRTRQRTRTSRPADWSCWQRARVAQFQTQLEGWQQALTVYAGCCDSSPTARNRPSFGEPPRLTHAKAAEQAGAMVERCHRLFLPTLRALQDLRRGRPVPQRLAQVTPIPGQQPVKVIPPK